MSGIKYDDEHPDLDFGETLGTFLGVEARSNLDDSYFSGESSYIQGVYTGYTYQCVEYSRRVLLVTRGVVFPNCGRASEIFAFEKATHVETGVEHNFVACKNGETTVKPEAGMILIYPYVEGVLPWGHIAVITEVGDDWVGIAEQNQSNKSWLGKPYGRVAKLLHDANTGAWTVQETLPDTHIRSALGWKYIEGVPLRTPISGEGHFVEYAPLKVLPQFLTPRMTPTMTRYRLPNKALEGTSDLHNRFRRDTKSKQYDQVPKDGACWPGPVQEFQSIYFANETMNVPSIPAANNTFQLIGRGLRATVASLSDDEVARRYNIPAFFVPAARLQLQDFNRASLIGTVVTVFSHEKGWRGVESRLDSQAPYAATVLGAQFADENGHGESWKPCTTNHDINRAVTRIAKLKHRVEHRTGEESVNTTLYILEVTAGLDLAVAFTEEEQAAVRLAALDVDVMAGQWEEWREERLKAHASGETGDDERPVFTIRRLGLNDESLRIFNGDILVDGVKADFVVKKEKWSWLFRLLTEKRCALQNQKAFEKFEAFMAAAASTKSTVPVVFQPLWAHMADQPKTLAEASAWGRAEAAKGNTKVANFAQVAPDASDFDEHGRCTLPLYAPDEVKLIKRRFRPQNPAQDPDDQVFASFAGLIVNGYSGFGAILEARRPRSSAPPPTIADAQHIGIRAMYFGGGDLDADMETP